MQFNNPPVKIQNDMTTPHLKKSIGSSSSRLALLLIALVFACLGIPQSAQAGYIVTLQQVGPNVVATGSGAFNLHGLTFSHSSSLNPVIVPLPGNFLVSGTSIYTGPASSSVDSYFVPQSGPMSFGTRGATAASSGSGDMVGIFEGFIYGDPLRLLSVPRGYVSGTALSDTAIYTGKILATLGVTPGTYVWTWGIGANQNFTLKILSEILPANGPPIVTTNPAAFIASFSATLKGSLNPDGLSTTFHFQYGTTTNYGLTSAPQTQIGDTFRPVSANVNSLAAHTTYHFRIVASNTAGTTFGSDRTFTTLTMTGPPVVRTNPATDVIASSANLNGRLDPHGLSTTVYFQYGTTNSYGSRTPNHIKTGNDYQNVFAGISGLTAGTTFHFRIVATNTVGTRYGTDRTLTTQ
jgi:hypothetical protein